MPLEELPAELLHMITDYLPRIEDVNSLNNTCQDCYDKLNWVLYKRDAETGSCAMLWAARHGRLNSTRLSLNAGGRVGITTGTFRATPLHIAASFGHTDLAAFLIQQGADIFAECSNGLTPLHFSILKRHLHTMRMLLAAGANPNATTGVLQFMPLHVASFAGHPDFVLELLRHGAKLHARDRNGETALHWSVRGTIALGNRRTERVEGWYEQRSVMVTANQLRRQRHCDCDSALAVVKVLMKRKAGRHIGKDGLAKLLEFVSKTNCINGRGGWGGKAHKSCSRNEMLSLLGAKPPGAQPRACTIL